MNIKITDMFLRLSYEICPRGSLTERWRQKKERKANQIRSEGKLDKMPDMGTGAEQDHAGKQIQQFYGAEVTLI